MDLLGESTGKRRGALFNTEVEKKNPQFFWYIDDPGFQTGVADDVDQSTVSKTINYVQKNYVKSRRMD